MPHYIKGTYSWGICGEDTPAYNIKSCEAPGAWALRYSKECPIQWDFQCRSLLESTPPLAAVQCTVTMWPHKPGTPGCLIRLLTCVWNLGIPAWESICAASQQTWKTDTWWHGVWDKANRDKVPKTWEVYSVYRGCRLQFPTLRICILIYIKQMVVYLAEETSCEWVTIKSSSHHLFFNPINYLQVCNTEIICSTWKQKTVKSNIRQSFIFCLPPTW